MLVKYWMTTSLKTVTGDNSVLDAVGLMRNHRIRRLPVLNSAALCGIVTDSDLYRFVSPSVLRGDLALSKDETLDLSKRKVADLQSPDPFVCGPDTPLEEAGEFMRKQKIGSLLVVDQGVLTGIVTESDIMEALSKLTLAEGGGMRVCFMIPMTEKLQLFYKMVETCELLELEILTLITHVLPSEKSHLVTIRVRGPKEEEFVQSLWQMKYKVILAGENAAHVRRFSEPAR